LTAALMTITPNTVVTCMRCRTGATARSSMNWNFVARRGVIVGFLCSSCQTPEENAEAEINDSTLDYAVDSFGRVVGKTKELA